MFSYVYFLRNTNTNTLTGGYYKSRTEEKDVSKIDIPLGHKLLGFINVSQDDLSRYQKPGYQDELKLYNIKFKELVWKDIFPVDEKEILESTSSVLAYNPYEAGLQFLCSRSNFLEIVKIIDISFAGTTQLDIFGGPSNV